MSCFAAVMHDVALARSLDVPSKGLLTPDTLKAFGGLQHRLVTLGDPAPLRNGACTLTIRFERVYTRCRRSESQLPHVAVHAEWDVIFGSSYPTEPCTWHFVEGRDTDADGVAVYRPARLWSFVVEDVVARMAVPSKLYIEACDGNATSSDAPLYPTSRDDAARFPLPAEVGIANVFSETLSDVEKKHRDSSTETSQFILDFVFLCSWWSSLELDDDSIMPVCDVGMHNGSFMGNVAVLDEDSNGSFPHQIRSNQFMDDDGGNMRVQRPRRKFAAVFMPHGGVLAWGFSQNQGTFKNDRETAGDAEQWNLFRRTQSGFLPYRSSGGVNKNDVGYLGVQDSQHQHRHVGRAFRMLYIYHGVGGTVLPSLLVRENILQTQLHQLSDICLYADDPSVSLRRNARISRNAKALRSVSSVFRMLSHLVKGVSPHAASLYVKCLLAPVLHRVIKEMQGWRQPFWAGVAICCIILPYVLNDRQTRLDIASHLIDPVECYRCVSLVSTFFSIVGLPIKFREAELAKSAIQNAFSASKPSLLHTSTCQVEKEESCNSSGSPTTTGIVALPKHPPVTECAVCGLSLLCSSSRGTNSGGAATVSGIHRDESAVLCSSREDKCLAVHCVRCGHGGHVAHIIAWWNDRSVRWCPKGCDCRCIY